MTWPRAGARDYWSDACDFLPLPSQPAHPDRPVPAPGDVGMGRWAGHMVPLTDNGIEARRGPVMCFTEPQGRDHRPGRQPRAPAGDEFDALPRTSEPASLPFIAPADASSPRCVCEVLLPSHARPSPFLQGKGGPGHDPHPAGSYLDARPGEKSSSQSGVTPDVADPLAQQRRQGGAGTLASETVRIPEASNKDLV